MPGHSEVESNEIADMEEYNNNHDNGGTADAGVDHHDRGYNGGGYSGGWSDGGGDGGADDGGL